MNYRPITLVMIGALSTVIAILIAACGGTPDAARVYANAGKEMASLSSYNLTALIKEGESSATLDMDLASPDRVHSRFEWSDGSESWGYSMIGIGRELYATDSASEDWYVYDEATAGEPAPRVVELATALSTRITDLSYVDKEDIAGVTTHRLQGTLPPDVLALIDEEEAPSAAVPIEVWVGTKDSLVRRYQWTYPEDGGRSMVVTLSRFDDGSINIVAPVNPRPAYEWPQQEEDEEQPMAHAMILDSSGARLGDVVLTQQEGKVSFEVKVKDLPPGFHGFHVHATGQCSPDFGASGGHLNPAGHDHPGHAADLPVLLVNADGRAGARGITDRFTLEDLLDADGSAVIIHAMPDNYANIPARYGVADSDTLKTGDAGSRIACGVIEPGPGEHPAHSASPY